ncbi:MAG: HAD hydrolase-like protein, partial [Verrucomicrobia bacterium]|nr:HAD hydrolase-like protein [Verrucomicrobiota bacterium]
MDWISHYQLFLFDLDGLLVNTEETHYRAYARMCRDRGFTLPWDFPAYFRIAQSHSDAIR